VHASTRTTDDKSHSQLIDSGCDRELVGTAYAVRHRMPLRRLKEPVNIEYMDGKAGKPITHATWQRIRIEAENGDRWFTIKYLCADIPEGMVLGRSWLGYANPDINWVSGQLRWRPMRKVMQARRMNTIKAAKARQQIIHEKSSTMRHQTGSRQGSQMFWRPNQRNYHQAGRVSITRSSFDQGSRHGANPTEAIHHKSEECSPT